jgi:oligopeptidase B
MSIKPPEAAKIPVRIEQLGRVRTDDYAWMKDAGWQKVLRDQGALRGDIKAHLLAENAYTAETLAGTEASSCFWPAPMRCRRRFSRN